MIKNKNKASLFFNLNDEGWPDLPDVIDGFHLIKLQRPLGGDTANALFYNRSRSMHNTVPYTGDVRRMFRQNKYKRIYCYGRVVRQRLEIASSPTIRER